MRFIELRRHTMRVKPGQHLSQAGVTLARRVGDTIGPFACVITSPLPRAFETAIAMGFAVDEQDDAFSLELGAVVEAEAGKWDAGFAAFGSAYHQNGATRQAADFLATRLREIVSGLPENGAVLIISHGGIVETAAVGCLPQADHAQWGAYCDYCEGIRVSFENGQFTAGSILRLEEEDRS